MTNLINIKQKVFTSTKPVLFSFVECKEIAHFLGLENKILDSERNSYIDSFVIPEKSIVLNQGRGWRKNTQFGDFLNAVSEKSLVINSFNSLRISDNKWLSYQHMIKNDIPTAETILTKVKNIPYAYCGLNGLELLDDKNFKPVFLKTLGGCGGLSVKYFSEREKLINFCYTLLSIHSNDDLILQKPVLTSLGRCVRVLLANGRIIASYLRKSKNDDPRANVCQGAEVVPYKMNDEWKKLVLETHNVFGLDISGIDVLFGENEQPVICEVNGYPGYSGAYKCGINPVEKIGNEIMRMYKEKFNV